MTGQWWQRPPARVQVVKAQVTEEAEHGRERRPQKVCLAKGRPAGGPRLPCGPHVPSLGFGSQTDGGLGVKSQLCVTSENSLRPAFPATVRQCVKGSYQ